MINNWIMLCVPRTASTSLSKMLKLRVDGGVGENAEGRYFGHMPAHMIRENVGAAHWNNCFTFGFARNPWDRLVSIAARINPRALETKDIFYTWMTTGCQSNKGEMHMATGGTPIHMPCWHFLAPCKFVGRYETMETDLSYICGAIECEIPEWRHDEKCDRKPYREYYDERSRNWVAWYYNKDIANYGYRFGG